jgi:ATP-dependent helicase/nuclease subunit A
MPTENTNTKPNTLDACDPALNATVSASAGSGKTWLLITRIVRLLIDGAEPGNIIALTFTRKAAGEMQIRLNQRLFEMATADDEKLNELLQMIGCSSNAQNIITSRNLYEKIMHSLYPIRIQTFHSFCQDILSRFPLEADIPPGFELVEDSSLLELQAWQALFEKAGSGVKTNPRLTGELANKLDIIMQACNGPDNTRTALHNFLSHRSDWWAYTSRVTNPVDFASEQLAQQLQIDENNTVDPIDEFLNDTTRGHLKVFANLLRDTQLKSNLPHADKIDTALNHYTDKNDVAYSMLRSAFLTQKGETMSRGRTYTKALEKKLGDENAERFVALHNKLATAILTVDEKLKRLATFKINSAWFYAGQQFVDIFQQLKREMRLLDFTDLEWKCYQLLQQADNAHWVQYKIDQRIDHLLIDEFQDTNPTQWHLLSPILEEIAANPEERQRTVFLVGDEKQSIYSFRRANPALQAQASDWLAQNLDARATPLDFSRRSSSAIIHCVNHIFEQDAVKAIMPGFTTHDTYLNKLPGKVLLCDLFEKDEDTNDDKTENEDDIQLDFRNPLKQAREISEKTLRHEEADYIARQILRLVNSDECSSDEYITDDGIARTIEYGDILILMRNRTHFKIYEDTLKQHAIPFIGSKKGGLLDNLEVQDLICLLNTLITPFNNLALAQVLKSPIFNASDNDLITLAQQTTKKERHWYQRLLRLAKEATTATTENPHETILSSALQRAAILLPRWQKMAEQLPVHDCLDKIFSQGNILNRYIAANRDENKYKAAANCQRFLELSLETDSGRYPSITRFLQQLNHLKKYSESPPEEPLSLSNESRVRLMTIHGSKGLEAPVVFLADCNSTARNNNAYSSLVRWPSDEKRPVSFQLQLSKDNTDHITQRLQQKKLDEQAREDLNLLYVALTRAREQLYISGVESRSKQSNSWYQIIHSGLNDISNSTTCLDEIKAQIYEHLSYESTCLNTPEPKNQPADISNTPITGIDERLLKPITEMPEASFMIAPGSNIYKDTAYTESSSPLFDKGKESLHPDGDAAFAKWRGITIHRVIEQLCNTEQYPAIHESLSQLQQKLLIDTQQCNPGFVDSIEDCIQEALTTFNHPDLMSIFKPDKERKTYNEMPLMYMNGQQAVYGIVDRVIKTRDQISIIDYKSHQLGTDTLENDELTAAANQFKNQLAYYCDGIEKMWPEHTIKAGILFTHHQQIVWVQ